VDEHRRLALAQAERGRGARVEDLVHALELEEVVAQADRSELGVAALVGPVRDRGRVGSVEASRGLGVLEVVLRADPEALDERPRPPAEDVLERGRVELERLLAGPGGNGAGDLVHERLGAPAQLLRAERKGEQADAAVDVVADAAG